MCFDSLSHNQQCFRPVCIPGLNKHLAEDKVSCSGTLAVPPVRVEFASTLKCDTILGGDLLCITE